MNRNRKDKSMNCDSGIYIKGYKSVAQLAAIIVATYASIVFVNKVSHGTFY